MKITEGGDQDSSSKDREILLCHLPGLGGGNNRGGFQRWMRCEAEIDAQSRPRRRTPGYWITMKRGESDRIVEARRRFEDCGEAADEAAREDYGLTKSRPPLRDK